MPEKIDQQASPSQKAVTLFCQLMFTGKKHYLKNLAQELRCTPQTIIRMIENIDRSYAVNIERGLDGRRRWYQIKMPKSRPKTTLSEDEISRLLLCKDMVQHLLPKQLSKELDMTIHKTTALLPDLDNRAEAFDSLAQVMLKGSIDYTPHEDTIRILLKAVQKKQVCEISYKSPNAPEPKAYYFAPLSLTPYREALYASGWKVDARTKPPTPIHEMNLPIQRFEAVELTRARHEIPEKNRPRYFGFPERPPFGVKVRFTAEAGKYVNERQWSADQQLFQLNDGSFELSFTAQSEPEVMSWVLAYGHEMELLKPSQLRERIKENLKKSLRRYD